MSKLNRDTEKDPFDELFGQGPVQSDDERPWEPLEDEGTPIWVWVVSVVVIAATVVFVLSNLSVGT